LHDQIPVLSRTDFVLSGEFDPVRRFPAHSGDVEMVERADIVCDPGEGFGTVKAHRTSSERLANPRSISGAAHRSNQ
jgi:hypothetical protein